MGVPPRGRNASNESEANLVPVNELVLGVITRVGVRVSGRRLV